MIINDHLVKKRKKFSDRDSLLLSFKHSTTAHHPERKNRDSQNDPKGDKTDDWPLPDETSLSIDVEVETNATG